MPAAAAFLLRGVCGSAFGTELSALRFCAARCADGAGDLVDLALLRPIHLTRLRLNLFARGLGLRRRHLFVEIGRAGLAEAGFLVPADRFADPVAAARALLEDRGDFVDGILQRAV